MIPSTTLLSLSRLFQHQERRATRIAAEQARLSAQNRAMADRIERLEATNRQLAEAVMRLAGAVERRLDDDAARRPVVVPHRTPHRTPRPLN